MTTQLRYLIPFKSSEGQNLLNASTIRQNLLLRIFCKQEKDGLCGVHSAALLMSARHFGAKYPERNQQADYDVSKVPYLDTTIFAFEETTRVFTRERLLTEGSTLKQLEDFLASHGVNCRRYHAGDIGVDEFRSLAKAALSRFDSTQGVLVNFKKDATLGDDRGVNWGHVSPLAAYEEKSDRFLLLDTYDFNDEIWIRADDMFYAMNTLDSRSGITRGFIIIG